MKDTPVWIVRACRLWGEQKRRIWLGTDQYGNVDGYAQSLLGRIREERDGASCGRPAQHFPEVFTGDGLQVQRSLQGLGERRYTALHVHYVWDPAWEISASRKARLLDVSRAEYFALVDRAETWIHARLEQQPVQTDFPHVIHRIIREALSNTCAVSTLQTKNGVSVPGLNLAALRRDVLGLKRPNAKPTYMPSQPMLST